MLLTYFALIDGSLSLFLSLAQQQQQHNGRLISVHSAYSACSAVEIELKLFFFVCCMQMSCGLQRQRLRCLLCLPVCLSLHWLLLPDQNNNCSTAKSQLYRHTHTHSNHTHTHTHAVIRCCELPTGLLTTCFAYKAALVMTSTPNHFPRSGCGWRLIVSLGGTQCALCCACVSPCVCVSVCFVCATRAESSPCK